MPRVSSLSPDHGVERSSPPGSFFLFRVALSVPLLPVGSSTFSPPARAFPVRYLVFRREPDSFPFLATLI